MNPRKASALAFLIALSLVFGSGIAMAQGGNETGGNETNETGGGTGAGGNETGGNATDAGEEEPSGFMEEGGLLIGDHVSFAFDAETGTICDWTFEEQLVIEGIAWAEFQGDSNVKGSAVQVRDEPGAAEPQNETGGNETGGNETGDETGNETTPDGACPGDITPPQDASGGQTDGNETQGQGQGGGGASAIKLHDTPNGFIKTEFREQETVQWTFAPNVTVSAEGPERVRIQGSGIAALLWKDRGQGPEGQEQSPTGFQVSGNQVTLSGDQENVMFRVEVVETPEDQEINTAVAEGDVAAEIVVLTDDDQLVADFGDVELVDVRLEETRITIDINVNVEIDVEQQPPQDPNQTGGNETGGNETGGNETGGNETGGNETGGGDFTGSAPVTVVIVDLDVTHVTNIQDLEVRIDDADVEIATGINDVLTMDEGASEAFIDADDVGNARLVASVATGSLSLTVSSASGEPIVEERFVTADTGDEPGPGFPGDAGEEPFDDGNETRLGDDGGDRGNETDVPAVGVVVTMLALLGTVILIARRRR